MGLGFDIGRILEQYSGAGAGRASHDVEQDFDNIAQNSPQEDLRDGLSQAFRSDQTPPFSNMVGQLFNQADTNQRTGMLNQLLGSVGPSVLASVLGGGALGGLGGLLNRGGGEQQVQLTPDQVDQLSPQQVEELAAHAERENPGVIDRMSSFYAQNPTLVKALGGAALAIALGHMSQRRR
ncbi:hypothetical protein [Noviherbaspirillum sp. Root189]|uniref:hypothetical protein n=1 Tax=Noviherbaspirillum sp. Root189 TaxID=1736487 RepID=UPI000B1FD4D8|nr:hypothetical protein [Noviherbaspirillum sp. Root189]